MAEKKMTRFEKSLREELKDSKLQRIDIIVINMMDNCSHMCCSPAEIEYAERLIREKQIKTSDISLIYYSGGNNKHYNGNVKRVTNCITRDQWQLLRKYYSGYSE